MPLPAFQRRHESAQVAGHFTPYPEPMKQIPIEHSRREPLRLPEESNRLSTAAIIALVVAIAVPTIAAILCKIFLP